MEVLIEGLLHGSKCELSIRWNETRGRCVYAEKMILKGEYVIEYVYSKSYTRYVVVVVIFSK